MQQQFLILMFDLYIRFNDNFIRYSPLLLFTFLFTLFIYELYDMYYIILVLNFCQLIFIGFLGFILL
jgi:hypothetical protein